jgi:hypothetical protein
LPTGPAAELLAPPPLARQARELGGRTYSADESREPGVQLRVGPEGEQQLRSQLEQLFPYSGNLWRVPYALNADYDLMLTAWGRYARGLAPTASAPTAAEREWGRRLLGAWDVRMVVVPRPAGELLAELRRSGRTPPRYRGLRNTRALPRFRFVRELGRVASPGRAVEALRGLGYDLRERDACIGAEAPAAARFAPAALLRADEDGQLVRLRYRSAGPAFLVAALTYDEGWRASLEDGGAVPTCTTLLGQIGVPLPPGEHELVLRYRDPWVRVGGSMTLLTLLAGALAASRLRRPAPLEAAER